jgi:hypothetical protein
MAIKINKRLVALILSLFGATATATTVHKIIENIHTGGGNINCIFPVFSNCGSSATPEENRVKTFENFNYHVTLDGEGGYIGVDKKNRDRMHLRKNPSEKSWQNQDYRYTIIRETQSLLIVRVTYPSGKSKDETLFIRNN